MCIEVIQLLRQINNLSTTNGGSSKHSAAVAAGPSAIPTRTITAVKQSKKCKKKKNRTDVRGHALLLCGHGADDDNGKGVPAHRKRRLKTRRF